MPPAPALRSILNRPATTDPSMEASVASQEDCDGLGEELDAVLVLRTAVTEATMPARAAAGVLAGADHVHGAGRQVVAAHPGDGSRLGSVTDVDVARVREQVAVVGGFPLVHVPLLETDGVERGMVAAQGDAHVLALEVQPGQHAAGNPALAALAAGPVLPLRGQTDLARERPLLAIHRIRHAIIGR